MSKKRERHIRKRGPIGDCVEDDSSELRSCLEGIRTLQKQRVKKTTNNSSSKEEKPGPELDDQEEQVLDAYVKETSMKRTSEIEEMDRYIEHHMKERLGKKQESESRQLSLDEIFDMELFKVPEQLKSSGPKEVSIPGLMTGITEVRLPIAIRLKNIEDTEQAKTELLETGTKGRNRSKKRKTEQGEEGGSGIKRSLFVSSFGRQQQPNPDEEGKSSE